jgi:hypothetical protein
MIVIILLAVILFIWVSVERYFQNLNSRLDAFYTRGGEHDRAWTNLEQQQKSDAKKEQKPP